MKRFLTLFFLLIFAVSLPLSALTVKLGSPFPDGSSWDQTLKKMAREWSDITGGRVKLKIYAGGIAGGEGDMVRKMRIGQLDAAVLTGLGVADIVSDILVFSLPFLIQSDDELNFVVRELLPTMDDKFRDKGFEVLVWSNSGWVNIFSRNKVYTPDDLRKTKLATSPDTPDMTEAFRALNFKTIPVNFNDTLMGLQSGMVDSFYSIPMATAAYQWFAVGKYMNPFPLAPVLGGLLISERTWKKIPQKYHEELKAAMKTVEQEFTEETARLNGEAMKVMKEYGLEVLEPSEEDNQAWRDLFKDGYWMIVGDGKGISEETYQFVDSKLKAFRAGR